MQCGFKFYSVLDCLVKNGEIYVRSDFSNVYETENHFSKNEFIHLLFSYDWVYNGDESNIPQFFFKACWCSKHPKNVCRNHLQLKSDLHVYLDALFGLWRIHSPFAVWHNKLVVTGVAEGCAAVPWHLVETVTVPGLHTLAVLGIEWVWWYKPFSEMRISTPK